MLVTAALGLGLGALVGLWASRRGPRATRRLQAQTRRRVIAAVRQARRAKATGPPNDGLSHLDSDEDDTGVRRPGSDGRPPRSPQD